MASGAGRVRRRIAAAVASACAVLLLAGCTTPSQAITEYDQVDAEFAPEVVERLDATLEEAVRLSGSSGAVAGVWAPWAGAWTTGVGTVDFGEGAPEVTPDTRFQLATATGAITCALMLRLVDAGVVALDDQVGTMVRGVPGLGGITLEHLCRHQSGIADYYPSLSRFFVGNPQRVWPATELVASGMAASRRFDPGTGWAESRTGVMLLATALEQHTGRTWADLVDQYVFEPLDLDETSIPPAQATDHTGALGGYAAGVLPDGNRDCEVVMDVSDRSSSIGGTAAGAYSTLDEAKRFSEAFANGTLFSENTARKVWTTTPFGGDAPAWQSQGIGAQQYGPMRGLAGVTTGALTAVFTEPETGLTVVVALNNSSSGGTLAREAAFALASIASKATASGEETPPLIELPWSYEQAVERMTAAAVCPLPAEVEATEETPAEEPATDG
ncbi:serine hydrolase domain-containing protein [Agromyces sp. C10]|uniref:serine hydrolase domain-containing protein n=1 Tax=Agromyces sp. C10 TaxID=2935077 RepID=UPI00200B43C0|nr:serine hydrolase domain-containing protein [Agromyces sp. C10]MCK8610027.1 beta-lactamase family protein [Agromyces sp. C10]